MSCQGLPIPKHQKWLCSGRTSLARDFRSVSLALIGRETEPNNEHSSHWSLYEPRAVGNSAYHWLILSSFDYSDFCPSSSCPTVPPVEFFLRGGEVALHKKQTRDTEL